jgi:UPF0755 protein
MEDNKTKVSEQEPIVENSAKEKVTTTVDDFNYLIGEDGFNISSLEESNKEAPIFRASREERLKKKKEGRKAGFKAAAWAFSIIIVSLVLAASIMLFAVEYLGLSIGEPKQCVVEIEKGSGTKKIAEELKNSGAISSPFMFRVYSKLSGNDGTYQYGVYNFSSELGYKDIARKLQTEGATAKTVTVTIPEMSRVDEIMQILEDKGVCTKADFKNAVRNGNYEFDFVKEIPVEEVHFKFEGYLFPDTYDFYCYDSAECAELAILKMLENTNKKLTQEVRAKIKASGYTIHEVLTMASIVELEASAAVSEMNNVAAVFYNRLVWDEPKKLGSSPTMDYPFGNGRYDTNIHEGLPPGPLCAPSENAILAAVSPTPNFSATYFVTDSEMNFYYNNSLAAHNKTIANLKSQGKWLG